MGSFRAASAPAGKQADMYAVKRKHVLVSRHSYPDKIYACAAPFSSRVPTLMRDPCMEHHALIYVVKTPQCASATVTVDHCKQDYHIDPFA
jgi:hypothetical protein